MKLIVGLGNPEGKYQKNRHNVGHMLVNALVEELDLNWEANSKLKADICKKDSVTFLKSHEYMNSSGIPVSLAMNFFKIDAKDLIVIHDDIDLPLGELKKQFSVGAAGHHGVESIISNLGSKDFWRIRVGVGRPTSGQQVEDFVLSNFSEDELKVISGINISSQIS